MSFIDSSPAAYQAVENIRKRLDENDFKELKSEDKWKLEKNGKYYLINNDSAIIGFQVGSGEEPSFKILGSHSDSPTFRIKPKSGLKDKSYLRLNTEVYGGPILSTWFDRPLSIAGRVFAKADKPYEPKKFLLNIDKDLLIIPNLAIHMNREVNDGYKFNPQKDTLPILAMVDERVNENDFLLNEIAEELKIEKDDILDFDLYLYPRERACILGSHEEFLSAGKLDNLAMAHASLEALIDSKSTNSTKLIVVTDNEEVGSQTKQGADSPYIANTLERIVLGSGGSREDYLRILSKSFMISCDMAHGLHPSHPEKSDPGNYPILGQGPVIKTAANKAYTSDGYSSSVYRSLCVEANIPVQDFTNRSDARGGSTIGPITASHIDIPSVDLGIASLAMHSVRELIACQDQYYTYKSFVEFFKD